MVDEKPRCTARARHKIVKHGEPHTLGERILDGSTPEPTTGCWLWRGARNPNGRPILSVKGKTKYAHRMAYETFVGSIGGALVCHSCDNMACVNPAHLWLGTQQDNQKDKVRKGRQARGAKVGSAKLTETDVAEIRRLRAGGMKYLELSRRFGVVHGAIGHILAGRAWAGR